MPYTETRTIVFARPANRESTRRFVGEYGPEAEGYGEVEIVRKTRVRQMRKDGTAMPGPTEETEEVLLRLNVAATLHLVNTLSSALAESLAAAKDFEPDQQQAAIYAHEEKR